MFDCRRLLVFVGSIRSMAPSKPIQNPFRNPVIPGNAVPIHHSDYENVRRTVPMTSNVNHLTMTKQNKHRKPLKSREMMNAKDVRLPIRTDRDWLDALEPFHGSNDAVGQELCGKQQPLGNSQ